MIRNLLFDLGGVIMDIKRMNCVHAFERLGMEDPERWLGEYSQKGPFMGVEDGSLTPAEFRDEVRAVLPNQVTDKEIDEAFCEFLVGIPEHRLAELRMLREHYHVYLLSNTNPIMWNGRIAEEFRKEGHDIGFYFDGIVTSFEAKCMKPEHRIFEYAMHKFEIRPEETLFFDDSRKNIEASERCGLKGLLVPPGSEFYDLFRNYRG